MSPYHPASSHPMMHEAQRFQGVPSAPNSPSGSVQGQLTYATGAASRHGSNDSALYSKESDGRGSSAHGVASGAIGGGYGPYAGMHGQSAPIMASKAPRTLGKRHSVTSIGTDTIDTHAHTKYAHTKGPMMWKQNDAEQDDYLHNPSSHDMLVDYRSFTLLSGRGCANMAALILVLGAIIGIFAGWPIVAWYHRTKLSTIGGTSFGVGGVNSTGQVPNVSNMASLIDSYTPQNAYTRTGFDGQQYDLVFSDEFEVDGRTFWSGDDPYWEAVDLHYWPTGDYEWYDPDAVTTKDGYLQFTITQQPLHGLNFRSGMLQSWNKFCFTGGYIEVSVSLPGISTVPGFWPGAWTMGNLVRAGYGATSDGTWPFSYNSCDVGTMKNQTNLDGVTPAAARTSGSREYGGELSYQPGQRLSACTCPSSASEHPGPNVNTGRGGPEIDIIEAQVSYNAARGGRYGTVSQSAQVAPYDTGYHASQTSPDAVIYNAQNTYFNDYIGGIYQQAVSAVSTTNPNAYVAGAGDFSSYGFEYFPDGSNGFITWQAGGVQTWTLNAAAIGPNADTQVSQRLISEEPMYIILNLGFSAAFQTIDWQHLQFPMNYLIDYVRVYQRTGSSNVGCDPQTRPTAKYIQNHLNAYTNPNLTTWAQAGYQFPVNRLQNGGSCP